MIPTNHIPSNFKNIIKRITYPRIPANISKNFKNLNESASAEVARSLINHYFNKQIWNNINSPEEYLSSGEGQRDLFGHLKGRLDGFRRTVIPWLNDAKLLLGANILEIGCGTGSLTVALAEQGAKVAAMDIDEESLIVAKDRCRIYELNADFFKANANMASSLFLDRHFDFIIFSASLEHLNHMERIAAMKNTWNMLSTDDLWCVIEAPNRLWYFDAHTSILPFYHWLPDDLALEYSRFSPRQPYRNAYREKNLESMASFLRHGRGVSFHEFDLSMKKVEELEVVSSLPLYIRKRNLILQLAWWFTLDHRYESVLASVGPKIHKGFYQQFLNLIIKKS